MTPSIARLAIAAGRAGVARVARYAFVVRHAQHGPTWAWKIGSAACARAVACAAGALRADARLDDVQAARAAGIAVVPCGARSLRAVGRLAACARCARGLLHRWRQREVVAGLGGCTGREGGEQCGHLPTRNRDVMVEPRLRIIQWREKQPRAPVSRQQSLPESSGGSGAGEVHEDSDRVTEDESQRTVASAQRTMAASN